MWMDNVEKLRTRGFLRLEEPREMGSPDMHYPELGMLEEMPDRWDQVGLLGTPVLIHLDRVVDFTDPPPSSSSHGSSDSGISGLPSDELTVPSWPVKWGYRWYIAYEDGDFPPTTHRGSAHSRLRFPRGGAGGAGGGASSGYRRRQYGNGGHGGPSRPARDQEASSGGPTAGQGARGGYDRRRHHGTARDAPPPLVDADLTGPAGSEADPFVGSDAAPVLESQADKLTATKADMGQRPSEFGQGAGCLSLATDCA